MKGSIILSILLLGFAVVSPLSGEAPDNAPPASSTYYTPLTESDKENIRYIITTLATNSSISLIIYKKKLEQAGNRLNNVHPLTFLSYIFTDRTLGRYVKKIHGMPWREFAKGMAGSLNSAAKNNDLPDAAISDFLKSIGVQRNALENTIKQARWYEFIDQARDRFQPLAMRHLDNCPAAHLVLASRD